MSASLYQPAPSAAQVASANAILANPRATQGGVAFDGSAGTRVFSTLTGQNILTDGLSIVVKFRVPSANPAAIQGVFALASSATDGTQANALIGYIDTTTTFRARIHGATTGDYNEVSLSLTAFAGQSILLVLTRSGATVVVYINGGAQSVATATAGTPPTWAGSITSTFFNLGFLANTTVYAGVIRVGVFYNFALDATAITEIYNLGGAVPERFKFGSQVDSSSATSWASALLAYDTFSGVSASGFTAVAAAGTKVAQKLTGRPLTSGRQWLATFTATLTSGAVPQIIFYDDAALTNESSTPTAIAAGANAMTVTLTRTAAAPAITFRTIGASSFAISSFVLKQIGAVCHFDGDSDGAGFQWHDQSTNKLDAVLTTTGVSWTKPLRIGYVRGSLSWTATHEAKSLLGQRALPDGAVLEVLTLDATVASVGGATVGTTTTAARWRALAALGTAKEVSTLANRIPASTAANDSDILVDPDTANITTVIQVEARYYITEGT
jgi:hypothetical protein